MTMGVVTWLLCTLALLGVTPGLHGYEITRVHNLGNLKSHTYTLDVDLKIQGDIRWKLNRDTSATLVTVKKSASDQLDLGNVEVKVTVDETYKVIKVRSGQVGLSAGSRVHVTSLLPVLLALWWGDSQRVTLLGTAATLILLLCNEGIQADKMGDVRADVTIETPPHTMMVAGLKARAGKVEVTPEQVRSTSCTSGTPPTGECDMCCHGNGVCNQGNCICHQGYQNGDNCKTSNATEVTISPPPQEGTISVILTVENNVTNDARAFTFCTTVMTSGGSTAYDVINQTAHDNPTVSIESKYFSGLGYYLSAVNGLAENSNESLYWGFGRRAPEGDCLFPVGVSSYYPLDMENLLFTYITYGMFDQFSTCLVQNENVTLDFSYNSQSTCFTRG